MLLNVVRTPRVDRLKRLTTMIKYENTRYLHTIALLRVPALTEEREPRREIDR